MTTTTTDTCPTCYGMLYESWTCPECGDEHEPLTVEQYGAAVRDQFPSATNVAFEGAVEQTSDEDLMTFMSYGFRVSLTNGQQFDIVITER